MRLKEREKKTSQKIKSERKRERENCFALMTVEKSAAAKLTRVNRA